MWRRLAPGYYVREDGAKIIGQYVNAEMACGYGAGWRWTFVSAEGHANDPEPTLRDAKASSGCACMVENPGDGWGERVVTHSLRCPLHPEH